MSTPSQAPPLPRPDKTRCAQCNKPESTTQPFRRCAKCRTFPYCSVECQRADWKSHKQVCNLYVMENCMNYHGVFFGEKPAKTKKGEIKRTRGQIMNDLMAYGQSHNGDTLTVSAWNLLGLTKDITRAQTHFLALTLRRTDSNNPRTLYSLVDVQELPWDVLEASYAGVADLVNENPICPRTIFKRDEEERKRDGGLGSVMVVSIELPKGENRSPHDALKQRCVHVLQPLGLFNVHKKSLSRFPPLTREAYVKCLKNGLDGGAYSMRFQPYTPLD